MKHEPCPVEKMYTENPDNTICEVLREIYHKTVDEDIRMLCRLATSMAKAMDGKLRSYKQEWDDGFWDRRVINE